MTDNTEFLILVHDLLEKADQSENFLKLLANESTLVPEAQVEFAKAQMVVRLQSHLLRKLVEERSETHDRVEEIVTKYNLKS
jgi:hypothetical protein